MKKIIATVLAMVMALALCTTAFAAGFIGDDMDKAAAAAKDGSTTTVVTKIQDARADSTNSYAPLYLLTSTTKDANGNVTNTTTKNAVEMADAHGADTVYVEGSTVRYFKTATSAPAATVKVTAATVVTKLADVKCGSLVASADDDVYVTSADVYYLGSADSDATMALVGDKYVMVKTVTLTEQTAAATTAVPAAGTLIGVVHNYKADTTKVNGDESITKVYCTKCNSTFKFVDGSEAKAIKEFGVGNYAATNLTSLNKGTVYVMKTASATTPSTDKNTSPKTFDAGIAMYVGMALTSVAGSALVIGKKKEF